MEKRLILLLLVLGCVPLAKEQQGLEFVDLPPGFSIAYYAQDVEGARSMVMHNDVLYVGTRSQGRVYALPDKDKDHAADEVMVVDEGLNSPNGVAVRDGDLYVAEINRILRYDDITLRYQDAPEPEVIFADYPDDPSHGWKYIAFGPDGLLYVPVGAPCNVCEREDPYASLTRLDVNTGQMEIIARGIRNTVGFDWHPVTQELWFTDNGRDWWGDDVPPDELNRLSRKGEHFGFPYCHGTMQDDEFDSRSCGEFTAPQIALGPHVAALGMDFYEGSMFPPQYRGDIFIAEHGSWNRQDPIGYRITRVELDQNNEAVSYEVFADGWLQDNIKLGRPVDVIELDDGSLLVSDDQADAIYRITYEE